MGIFEPSPIIKLLGMLLMFLGALIQAVFGGI